MITRFNAEYKDRVKRKEKFSAKERPGIGPASIMRILYEALGKALTSAGRIITTWKRKRKAPWKLEGVRTDADMTVDLGEYRGFPMQASLNGVNFKVRLKGNLTYSATLSNDPAGNVNRINNALETIKSNPQAHKAAHERLESDMAAAKIEAEPPSRETYRREAERPRQSDRKPMSLTLGERCGIL